MPFLLDGGSKEDSWKFVLFHEHRAFDCNLTIYNTEHLTMITSSLNLHIISYTEEELQTMYYTM
jgi:hypothetical protein